MTELASPTAKLPAFQSASAPDHDQVAAQLSPSSSLIFALWHHVLVRRPELLHLIRPPLTSLHHSLIRRRGSPAPLCSLSCLSWPPRVPLPGFR